MLQRIQSIWLFLAFISAMLLFFFPIADITQNAVHFKLLYRGIYSGIGETLKMQIYTLPLAIMQLIIALLSVITIFLFRKRSLQMRFCMYNSILTIVSVGLIYFSSAMLLDGGEASYNFVAFTPIVTFVLLLLARNGIKKDIKLVKSLDRIR